MKIAVVGAGPIGGTLALRWSAGGHDVALANSRGPDSLAAVVDGTSVSAAPVDTVADGCDVLVLSVPFGAVAGLSHIVGTLPEAVTVVDTGNYVPVYRDPVVTAIDDGAVESEWVAETLGRPITKVFNSISAASLRAAGRPADVGVALPIATDRDRDRLTAEHLVRDAGFDPVYTGSLSESWRQQPGTPVYTADLHAAAARDALRRAHRDDTVTWRKHMIDVARAGQALHGAA